MVQCNDLLDVSMTRLGLATLNESSRALEKGGGTKLLGTFLHIIIEVDQENWRMIKHFYLKEAIYV